MDTKASKITEAVDRIAASRAFHRAGRSVGLLRYLAGKAAEGSSLEIKEYSIAVDVLGRAEYDPKIDSAVRVEAAELRKRLARYYGGEGANDPIRIELPKGGYVLSIEERQGATPSKAAAPGNRRLWVAAAAATLVAVSVSLWQAGRRPSGTGGPPAIAVLPVADLSPAGKLGTFCEGLTEEVINTLAGIDGLRVPSRASVLEYKNRNPGVRAMGEELKVHAVLAGSVRTEAGRVRATFQLINARDGFHLWSQTFDQEMGEDLAVQRRVAQRIGTLFRSYLQGATKGLARPGTRNGDAWHYYLLAARMQTSSEPVKAAQYYRAAVAEDPSYARAMAGLAISLITQAEWLLGPPEELLEEAYRFGTRAAQIDGELAESQQALGAVKVFHERDWAGAERAFRRAMEIDPSEVAVLRDYARLALSPLGRHEEAMAVLNQAIALRPDVHVLKNTLASVYLRVGRFEQAGELLKESIRIGSAAPAAYAMLGLAARLRGDHEEALRRFEEAWTRNQSQWTLGRRGVGLAGLGRRAEARQLIGELWSQYEIASIQAALGDKEAAVTALGRAIVRRETQTVWVAVDPLFSSLHGDARFGDLLRKMRLK